MNVRRKLVGLLALFLVAPMLAMMPSASAQDAGPTCSVTNGDGGINLSWSIDPDAASYVYRLEVEGQSNRYGQVSGGTALISMPDGVVGTVALSSKYADGSYEPSRSCGSAQATAGSGTQDSECSMSAANGGVNVTWTPVAGAVAYVYRLATSEFAVRYGRVTTGTSTFIPLGEGIEASVRVSAVYPNGSYQPSVPCGSATPNSGTGQQPFECSVAEAGGTISLSWTNAPDAVRYVYRLETPGQNNRYGVVTGNQANIGAGPAGASVTVFLSGQNAEGRYTPSAPCGTATVGGENPPIVISNCRVVDQGDGVTIEWDAQNTELYERVTWRYLYSWELPDSLQLSTDVGRAFGPAVRSTNKISFPVGTFLPGPTVNVEFADGQLGNFDIRATCEGGTVGGDIDPTITTCSIVNQGNGVSLAWQTRGVSATDNVRWVAEYTYREPGSTEIQTREFFEAGATTRVSFNDRRPAGTEILTAKIAFDAINSGPLGDAKVYTDCGPGIVVGGGANA